MTDLPRKTVARTARLAALPLGYAGRSAMGLGKRLAGRPGEVVMTEVQQRTAEQLFRTLGELKGGAMKFGQALSVLEAALPDEVAAPYRAHLTALQDSAPPMPTQTVRDQIADGLGDDWRDRLVWLDGGPAAAASIGQVHKGRWHDGREVAVKVQYPGAGDALLGDLRQLARVARGLAPVFPGIDIVPLVEELQRRAADELDYAARGRGADGVRRCLRATIPTSSCRASSPSARPCWSASGSRAPPRSRPSSRTAPSSERDHYGELLVRFLFAGPARTGMLHADPHPGNFRLLPGADGAPARLGVLDFGAVARLPEGGLPPRDGHAAADRRRRRPGGSSRRVCGVRASSRTGSSRSPAGPRLSRAVRGADAGGDVPFSREWMRGQFERLNNPREPSFTVATKLNLPPSYLLIHRTWLGGIGVLSQLEARAPFRAILEESLPGFAGD